MGAFFINPQRELRLGLRMLSVPHMLLVRLSPCVYVVLKASNRALLSRRGVQLSPRLK
jgi:hypothetical protein